MSEIFHHSAWAMIPPGGGGVVTGRAAFGYAPNRAPNRSPKQSLDIYCPTAGTRFAGAPSWLCQIRVRDYGKQLKLNGT